MKSKVFTVLLCAVLAAGCSSTAASSAASSAKKDSASEKSSETETSSASEKTSESDLAETETKETEITEEVPAAETTNELLNKYSAGTYCVAVDGLRARTSPSRESEIVASDFQKGYSFEVTEVVGGEDDLNSVWAKVEWPFTGYICIENEDGVYMMTKDEYIASGITTDAEIEEAGSESTPAETNPAAAYVNKTYKVVVNVLNVRKGPTTDAGVAAALTLGEEVPVEGVSINDDGSVWALVDHGFACITDGQGTWFMEEVK